MNREVKKLIIYELIISIIIIGFSIIMSNYYNRYYNKKIIENYSYIISNIKEREPNIDSEIVDIILKKNSNEEGLKLIHKYNLDDIDYINSINTTNTIIISITSIILILINYIFIKKIYYKIKKIDEYMNNILNDDYSLDIKEYCEGDISNLKNDIYKMTVKLKEQTELLTKDKKYLEELLEDISHQIKTPLTSMYMINDILNTTKDEKVREEFLIKNEKQIERIEWLIQSLLKMSRLDSGTIKLKKDKIKVKDLIDKSIQPINTLLNDINISYDIDNYDLNVDINWTSEAILNIIKNACEHTNNKIQIITKSNPIFKEIIIKDNGAGINKKDLPHIFERFYKGDHNKESIGIGLNMSKKIINLQNGIIEVNTSNKGTEFIIKFYKVL